jgi:hypothetical protein
MVCVFDSCPLGLVRVFDSCPSGLVCVLEVYLSYYEMQSFHC